MKKLLITIISTLVIFSCSTVKVDVPNFALRNAINSKINVEKDLRITKITPTLTNLYIKDKKLNLDVDVLANSFGKIANFSVSIETDIEYREGKIFTKDVKITKINGLGEDSLIRGSLSKVVETLFSDTEVFDVRNKNINPTLVKNIYIGNSNVVVEL